MNPFNSIYDKLNQDFEDALEAHVIKRFGSVEAFQLVAKDYTLDMQSIEPRVFDNSDLNEIQYRVGHQYRLRLKTQEERNAG